MIAGHLIYGCQTTSDSPNVPNPEAHAETQDGIYCSWFGGEREAYSIFPRMGVLSAWLHKSTQWFHVVFFPCT